MKFLSILIACCIGYSNLGCAERSGSALNPIKPIEIRIISRDEMGVDKREYFQCTPQTCCFAEDFYCFMENGHCVCDLHVCGRHKAPNKTYWMKIVGTEAERVCGRPRMLHDLTMLCQCDPYKAIPCGECNPPVPIVVPPVVINGVQVGPPVGASLPRDCTP